MNRDNHTFASSNTTPENRRDSYDIREQVSNDLSLKLSEYQDPKKGLKAMSALMGVHEKTLKRLIDRENKPSHQTLLKIYRTLFHTDSDSTVIGLLPENIAAYIKRYKPRGYQTNVNVSISIDHELQRDSVFCEIYCLAAAGGISKEYIVYHYGKYGESIIEKMLKLNVLVKLNKYRYILGSNQASLNPDAIKSVAIQLVNRFSKPEDSDELGQNYQSFYVEGLSQEAYAKWLEIEQKAYLQKVEVAKDPKNLGDIKAFTYGCIDTLIESDQDKYH